MNKEEDDSVLTELTNLAGDLYNEGYHCGINDNAWFGAWASAMLAVSRGEKYTDSLVIDILEKSKNE